MDLVSKTLEGLKGRLETWKGVLESKGLTGNVEMTKTIISSENSVKDTVEGKFPCAVCRKGVHSNSILCQFCGCWVNKNEVVLEVN